MQHPETDTGSSGLYWGKEEHTASVHVPRMIGTKLSHSPRIPTFAGNVISYVQADGNENMSSALIR